MRRHSTSPPGYSHRDHRAFRAAYRLIGLVVTAVLGLEAVVLVAPGAIGPAIGLLLLAAVGLGSVTISERLVSTYERDLNEVRAGVLARGDLRAEVALVRAVGAEDRPTRSPHSRQPRAVPPPPRGIEGADRRLST